MCIVTDTINEMIKEEHRNRFKIAPHGNIWMLTDGGVAFIQGTKDLILKYLRESGFLKDNM